MVLDLVILMPFYMKKWWKIIFSGIRKSKIHVYVSFFKGNKTVFGPFSIVCLLSDLLSHHLSQEFEKSYCSARIPPYLCIRNNKDSSPVGVKKQKTKNKT